MQRHRYDMLPDSAKLRALKRTRLADLSLVVAKPHFPSGLFLDENTVAA